MENPSACPELLLLLLRLGLLVNPEHRCPPSVSSEKPSPAPGLRAAATQVVKFLSVIHQPLLEGQPQKIGIILQAKLMHDAVLVEGDRARGNIQNRGGFLHGVALGKKLQYLALARSERASSFRAGISGNQLGEFIFEGRRDILGSIQNVTNGFQ